MASMKAKKGNPFEYDTLYSLIQKGYDAIRMDDNSKGIDIYVKDKEYFIECKRHKGFSWNQLSDFFWKTCETSGKKNVYLVFKANRQPTCVMYLQEDILTVQEFKNVFGCEWSKRPKGWKIYDSK